MTGVVNVAIGLPDANGVPPDDAAYQTAIAGILVVAVKVAVPLPQIDTSLVTGGGILIKVIDTLAVIVEAHIPFDTTAL
jgi:hypothetical protein